MSCKVQGDNGAATGVKLLITTFPRVPIDTHEISEGAIALVSVTIAGDEGGSEER